MEESQLYDAQTPGHVFAYRAFRSLFVRSPDSSPVKPSNEFNKENIPLPTKSPVKRSHDQVNSVTRTTPKRQRTSVVSPAKSILRNPAEPTPRSARLRDINVTFKDVRKSISPEINRKNPVSRAQKSSEEILQTQGNGKDLLDTKLSTQLKLSDNNPKTREPSLDKNEYLNPPQPRNVPHELEDYMRNTENEMKKLLKYGQKMREYARKQEEENTKLRKLLQEAREENDRLKRVIAFRQDDAYVLSEEKDIGHAVPNEIIEHGDTHSSKSKQQRPTTVRGASKTATPVEGIATTEPRITRSSAAESVRSQSRLKYDHIGDGEEDKCQLVTNPHLKRKQASPLPKDSPTSNANLEQEFAVPIRPASNRYVSTSSKMPSDRAMAARERLRRKTELRRASANMNAPSAMDESQLEWAGL